MASPGMHSKDSIRRGDEMVPVLVVRKPGCFYHTSRASVKGLAECAGHWVSTPLSPPEIPSGNPSRKDPCKGEQLGRAVKSKDPLNGITVHVQKTAHNINWQEARILARENNWGRRRVLEALEIQQRRPNLDTGLLLDRSWTPFVRPRS